MAGLYALRGYKEIGEEILRNYLKNHKDETVESVLELFGQFLYGYAILELSIFVTILIILQMKQHHILKSMSFIGHMEILVI